MIRFMGVPHYLVEENWHNTEKLVQESLDAVQQGRLFTTAFIKEQLLERNMQLWYVTDGSALVAVIITEVLIYPNGKVFSIPFLAGQTMDTWYTVGREILWNYALHHGCSFVRGYGRLGWRQKARELGAEVGITFDIPLGE